MYICVIYIYIYCVCVILKSPMSPWCVLLTWQGAKKAILWTAVPSWNQEPRCFGGGTITMFSTFHWNIHCRFFPTSYASVIRSSWPWRIAKVTGNTAPNLMMTPLILLQGNISVQASQLPIMPISSSLMPWTISSTCSVCVHWCTKQALVWYYGGRQWRFGGLEGRCCDEAIQTFVRQCTGNFVCTHLQRRRLWFGLGQSLPAIYRIWDRKWLKPS